MNIIITIFWALLVSSSVGIMVKVSDNVLCNMIYLGIVIFSLIVLLVIYTIKFKIR